MRLNDIMILWNGREQAAKNPGKPQIMIVPHKQNNLALNFLFKSTGACFGGWDVAQPDRQAAHCLAVFAHAVGRDGVPGDQAQAEFMKVEEYREWVAEGTGPFSDVYWAWSARMEEVA